jgi:hypothetical protein
MQLITDRPSGYKKAEAAVTEVKLWEAFLLYNRHNLYNTLSTYSLDNGPLPKADNDLATVTFRFMTRDWNKTLRDLLDRHNIPVIKESNLVMEDNAIWH